MSPEALKRYLATTYAVKHEANKPKRVDSKLIQILLKKEETILVPPVLKVVNTSYGGNYRLPTIRSLFGRFGLADLDSPS